MRWQQRLRRLESTTSPICPACGAGSPDERVRSEIGPLRVFGEPAPVNVGLTKQCPRCGRTSPIVLTILPPRELDLSA